VPFCRNSENWRDTFDDYYKKGTGIKYSHFKALSFGMAVILRDEPAFMDTTDVPHGAVARVHYRSSSLGRTRRMHVYTPPG
jgi:hypothetical protein